MAKKSLKKNDATMYKGSNADELFNLVKTENGVIILVGKYKVTNKTFKTFEEADEYIASKPYDILINVCVLFSKLNQNEEKEQNAAKNAENTKSSK